AALIVNYKDLKQGGTIIANTGSFTEKDLAKAKLDSNPLTDGTLDGYRVIPVDINQRVLEVLADSELSKKAILRCKNFYTLGMMFWLYTRPLEPTMKWLDKKFASKPAVAEANKKALQAGRNLASTLELFQGRYRVDACRDLAAGTYRNIIGNEAIAIGLATGAELAGLKPLLGSYPITPATDILQYLSAMKNFDVVTLQMEDEIAGICSAIGGSYAGRLGITTTSGPGMALKTEALGLAVITELPLVVVNVQRAGPSTGLPTKVEQSDLLQSIFGRNGEAPIPVIACATPGDAFECTVEACRIAVEYMTPVILLSDNYIANGTEPWKLPIIEDLPKINTYIAKEGEEYLPYKRDERLVRKWAAPGVKGLEHRIGGLEKDERGGVSHDPENHELMSHLREDKILGIRETIPTPQPTGDENSKLLIVSWGSPYGAIRSATEQMNLDGSNIAHLHLRHLWPMPHGLLEIFEKYDRIVIPEMNLGQMKKVLTMCYPSIKFESYTKIQGKPFTAYQLKARFAVILEEMS
ncbi:2-oxoacid:acceptor oxidoreductase subunit alpha, partial [bacterium]|nr:2-oxoacid:acceptor oxidoreductase subunit alpha [bacterium]